MEDKNEDKTLTPEQRLELIKAVNEMKAFNLKSKEGPYVHSTKDDLEKALEHIKELKNFIVRGQDYEAAAGLRDLEKKIVIEIDKRTK